MRTLSDSELVTYELAAWTVVVDVFPDADARDEFVGCQVVVGPLSQREAGRGAVDTSCLRPRLVDLLTRAWRRPVRAGELDAYEALFLHVFEGAGPTMASRATLAAVLLSPDFLSLPNLIEALGEQIKCVGPDLFHAWIHHCDYVPQQS